MRRAAAALGILAAAGGWVALAFAIFGPTESWATCDSNGTCATGASSLFQAGISGPAAESIAFIALVMVGIGIGSVLIARGLITAGLIIFITGFVALVSATVRADFIGPELIPVDLVVLAAVITAAWASRTARTDTHPAAQ